MSHFSNVAKIATGVLILAGAGLSSAFNTASQSISVRAEVPLSCQVSLEGGSGTFSAAGFANLGSTKEFCNSAQGYSIFARADGAAAGASIIVDGRTFDLAAGGNEFAIVTAQGPALTSRAISYDAGNTDGGGRLTLRIQAN
jgi:hypothetical protein